MMIYFKRSTGGSNSKGSSSTSTTNESSRNVGYGSSGQWMDDHRCIGRTFEGTTDTYGGLKK